MNALTNALIEKMRAQNWNQAQMAKHLGLSTSLFCMILSQKRKPSLRVIKAIYHKFPEFIDILLQ